MPRQTIATIFAVVAFVFIAPVAGAQDVAQAADPYANETTEQRDARMAWFREAKFGMFIHWGVYSVPAGTHNGEKIPRHGEWIMHRGKIPMAEYQTYAKDFNPVKYDPDQWVRLAKEAGMKYLVITSKHHDGFALFDSKVSKWDVVDATPYGKDLIAPLAKACQKHGLRLGLYYSQAQDWNQGGSVAKGAWDPAQNHDMDDYIRNIAVPQVKEILSNYGPISVLWWDTPIRMNEDRSSRLLAQLKLQPGIIHNNRLFHDKSGGDIKTPEQHIPGTGLPGDWESCMTMNGTWGYKSYDNKWKSSKTLIHNLVDIASKGGNYLLNVGPTAEGLIPAPSIERLKDIGDWMTVNSQSIYGTTSSPCNRPAWGRITAKESDEATTLYLNVFDWPKDGSLFLPVTNKVNACYLLADRSRIFQTQSDSLGTTVMVSGSAPDSISSVVVIELNGRPKVSDADQIIQQADGAIALPASKAIINNHFGTHAVYDAAKKHIGSWKSSKTTVDWSFRVNTPGTFTISALAACVEDSSYEVSVADQSIVAEVSATGSYDTFLQFNNGNITIDQAGKYTLSFTPIGNKWKPINLRSVRLTPIEIK